MATPATVLAIVRAARPVFRQRADALAFALHAALLAEGFVLVAAGASAEDEHGADAALREAGPDGWDASPDEYAFRYRQESAGSGTVVLKALAASGKLFVDAAGATPAAEAAHLELSIDDYTTEKLGSGYADVYSNLEGLLARIRAALLPTLKPEAARHTEAAGQARRDSEPEPAYEGGYGGGGRWEPERPPGYFGGVGDQDRFPAGMAFIPPLGPMVPPGGGGGMLIGPNYPGFFPGSGHAPGHPPQLPPGVPPGARYDPYGPPGVPGFEPGRFGTGRGRGGPPMPGQPPPVHPDIAQLGGDDDAHLFM